MKVILVDDERIALEHIRSLLPWEELGFEIAATASNGRSALRLCEEIGPQIMIVDIRMPVMDGMELIRAVADRKLCVKFIVMSAYEDFHYARQAISFGNVSSYLIKHEVDRDKLLQELSKAKESWETDDRQRRMQRSEQLMKAIIGTELTTTLFEQNEAKPPYAMLLIQRDVPFTAIRSIHGSAESTSSFTWDTAEFHLCADNPSWQLVGEFPLHRKPFVALFSQKNKSAALLRDSFRELAATIQQHLKRHCDHSYSLFFSFQNQNFTSLQHSLRQIEAAARHAVFGGKEQLLCVDELSLLAHDQADPMWFPSFHLEKLLEGMNQNEPEQIASAIHKLFESVCHPQWNLPGLYELVHALTALVNQRLAVSKGLLETNPLDMKETGPIFHVDQIMNRFITILQSLCSKRIKHDRLSAKMRNALRYIHEHYHEDINIEDVSRSTCISASYLHQLFKRELERTFLDYLTEHRILQAKRILIQEDAKMTEVSARVGYRSPQHFSQVFKKMTGMLPHQYRHGGYPS
ncbi:response regulator transcription factor [Paenibacillus sp. sgz302251]|uniref:response regulator transcription factor n=1 Tax=Paenibacillus sp. sgz302251 TaxID=3414493 RepID=UPI003C7CC4E2